MAGQQPAAVFYPCAALYSGFHEISELASDIGQDRHQRDLPIRQFAHKMTHIENRGHNGHDNGRNRPLPRFLRTDDRSKLMPSEGATCVISSTIAEPVHSEGEEQQMNADVSQVRSEPPWGESVEGAEERTGHLRKNLTQLHLSKKDDKRQGGK